MEENQSDNEPVDVYKFESVGDWEGLYVDGELVEENHQGRVDVLRYIGGKNIGTAKFMCVNLPENVSRYPSTLQEVSDDDRFDFSLDE
jgi:hypothetical protein